MLHAPIPTNEPSRLEALYSYGILDTLPEQEFDDIVRLAAYICGVPVSLISLVDSDRCWFKSKVGVEQSEVPRKVAYAAYAITLPNGPFIIPDAFADDRFADGPLVEGDAPMRFYVGTPLIDEDGFALGTLCVADHVPRQLTAEQMDALGALASQTVTLFRLRREAIERDRLNQRLVKAYEDLESFSYSVSHDLRGPVRQIYGLVEVLEEDHADVLDEAGRNCLNGLKRGSLRMNTLIHDLMTLATIHRSALDIERVDLTALCEEIVGEIPQSRNANVIISAGLTAHCDRSLARIALCNLLDNAFKYSSHNPNPEVLVSTRWVAGRRFFTICDNGVGFHAGEGSEDAVFRPFTRLHDADEFEGSGIGLAIVRRVFDRHGGEVHAESRLREGATFLWRFR